MTATIQQTRTKPTSGDGSGRVTTVISCPGVHPMARIDLAGDIRGSANENHWYDSVGIRRQWFANILGLGFVLLILYAGVWIVTEFARLQKVIACYEAGRRECVALDISKQPPARTP